MDRNEPATIDQIFTEDASLERPGKVWCGHKEIRTVPGWLHERCVNLTHYVLNQPPNIDGDRATAETYGHSKLIQRGPSGNLFVFEQGIRYQDSLVRRDYQWRFTRRLLVYDWTKTRTVRLGDDV